jgi:hypothetical protein
MLLSSHEAFPTKHCLTNPVQIRVLCPGSCKAYMHLHVRTQEFAYIHKKKRSLGKKINKDPLYIIFNINKDVDVDTNPMSEMWSLNS